MTLIVFTQSYPYDFASEHIFIQSEIHHLVETFEKVILVPRISSGNRLPVTGAVAVHEEYSGFLQKGSDPRRVIKTAFFSPCLFPEIREHPSILLYPSKIAKLILFSARAELTRRWLSNLIRTQSVDPGNCVLYSYWFDHAATGLSMAKREFPDIKVVSRAHGYDIYEEYYYPYYWPCRRDTLAALDMLFFASDAGRSYVTEGYPEYSSKFETAHLGTEDPMFTARPSSDGIFRIISCSHIVSVKRIDLLLEGVAAAAHLRPRQKFEWIHFGDGTGLKTLHRQIAQVLPANAHGLLLGHVPNHEIMQYYKEQPVDVFVNVSSTEGGAPVSIQEAISCGIPVVATSVGGNPEVVSEKNGVLLSPNPKPQEIAEALLQIWDDRPLAAKMRVESRRLWQRSYNAEVNFRAFAERLKAIGER